MAINVEGYAAMAPASERQRQQSDARQDRWMYELEHAMLQSAKKPAPQTGGRQQSATQEDLPLPARQARAGAQDQAGTGAAVTPAAPIAAGGAPAAAPASATGAAKAAAAAAPAPAGSAPPAAAHTPGAARALAASVATPASAVAAIGAAHAVAAMAAPGAAVMAPLAAARNLATAVAAGADPLGTGAAAKTAAASPGWLPGARAAAAPSAEHATALDSAEAAAPPAEAAPAGDDQQYAARLLHVYRDADGVQAWVRDAALGQQQAQRLAQTMASELGATGAPLTALTVNGRRQALPAGVRAGQPPADDYTAEADAVAPATRFTPYLNGAL